MCMILVYVVLGEMKAVSENHQLLSAFSVPSLLISAVWNFILFSIHFDVAIKNDVRIIIN